MKLKEFNHRMYETLLREALDAWNLRRLDELYNILGKVTINIESRDDGQFWMAALAADIATRLDRSGADRFVEWLREQAAGAESHPTPRMDGGFI